MVKDVSTPQADGDSTNDKRAEKYTEENAADEEIVDGRESGLDPDYSDDSPSAEEAEIQEKKKG